MSQVGDPAIKLFGKTIGLNHERGLLNTTKGSLSSTASNEDNKITSEELPQSKQENELTDPTEDSLVEPETSSGISDGTKMQDADKDTSSPKSTKNEDPNDEKTLKKPDKLLPCPRCNSMETKFCYYNNYNVNQPRYFCKKCQRYWTAGGTMRNVPVGSGRRKNKSCSTSNYHHLDAFQAARVEAAHGMHLPGVRANGSVLAFGSDKPYCDSMVSVLNLAEKNTIANGYHHGYDQRMPASYENRNDVSNGPCSTSSILTEKDKSSATHDLPWKNFQAFPPQVPYFPGPPWSYSGYPVSFYPAPSYWGCTVPSPWNMPWLSPTQACSDQSVHNSCPTSLPLGKHSRDGSMVNPSQTGTLPEREAGRTVLIPKTLRIDDPDEAAKSSIWSTLGIKNEKIDSIRGARLFKAFDTKADHRNHEDDTSLVLQANPAALSRSLKFRESTR